MGRKHLLIALKIGVSVALLGGLLWQFDFGPVMAQVRGMEAGWLVAAFGVLIVHGFVSAWRWQAIMRLQGGEPGYAATLRLFFIGMFFNQTLSTTLGGDAARVWLLRATGTTAGKAATGIVLERAAGMLAMMALVPAAVLSAPLGGHIAVPILIVTCLLLVAAMLFGPLLRRSPWPILQGVGGFLAEARRVLVSRAGLPVLALSLAIHLGSGFTIWLVAMAADASPGLHVCLFLSPLALLLATLPVSFGGWGVREAALVGLFAPFGVATEEALGVSIVMGLLVMLAGLPGGALWLMRGRTPRATPIQPG
jgi:uncharacterized membrane protein YbhN (UPF0104 family)